MFDSFSTPIQTKALTLDGIQRASGLNWVEVDLNSPQIPSAQGIYVWVEADSPHALWYHGSGNGKGGLRARLMNQLRWRTNQITRAALDPSDTNETDAYNFAREVPAVQQAAGNRRLFYALAVQAPWSIERNAIAPPSGALEWESFISAVSLLTNGHRGLIGGGAWESKTGTIAELMTDLAWDRLVDLEGINWV